MHGSKDMDQVSHRNASAPTFPRNRNMTTIEVFDARNRWSELVERAFRGEKIVITRRGQVVARLMPPRADAQGQARALAARIRLNRVKHQAANTGILTRQMIEDGRR
ncbi:MAG: hypothetical protein AD742_11450 [Methylibium sp. NZG]|nr:MAG: hypothetical protein AD742_11450 [Methylibium sp. NZG]